MQAILLKSNGIEVMSPTNSSQFRLACAFERANGAWPTFLLGSSEDSRLEIGSFKAGGEISGDSHRHCFGFEVKVPQVLLVIKTGGGDGFVKKVLPPDGLQSEFQAGIGWSSLNGFYFKGSASLVVNLSLHKTFGPVTLHSVYIGVGIGEGEALTIRIAMSGNVSLGPVSVTLERIGIQAGVDFPKEGGNLGPLQFNPPDFLGPRGLGLTVKAAGVTGGGYLSFDKANHLYSGALQLQFAKVGLDAIGFITTGGPDGFSLVININTKFTPPVQLSFGFMLVAVGGLIAINRSMSVEALQAGMLDGTLDSLLFPRNPVAQAPRIIQDLQRVLPAQDGRYVVGPMLRLTWGAKSLVKIDLGLFFELPNPLRMLLAGQLDVAVPHEDKALIKFQAAILGLLDLGRKVLAIDTRIKEGSHIVGFEVLGDTALRLSWGEKPYFLLSMGGFHPKFPVPAVYPALPQPFHRLSLV
ncbi:MAG: hypothetical protein KDD43_12330, partial [Bdellovibrionales bacterium]|nr:hypothetical protein [Bdellovibrionales bacterium]